MFIQNCLSQQFFKSGISFMELPLEFQMGLSYDAWTQVYQCFHPEGGGIGPFWKIWGLISHIHVRGTILCQFKNPLDMPSYLDLIVSRFSSWNVLGPDPVKFLTAVTGLAVQSLGFQSRLHSKEGLRSWIDRSPLLHHRKTITPPPFAPRKTFDRCMTNTLKS